SGSAAVELRRDARLVSLLRNAIVNAAGDDGWSNLSAVRTQISNQASFDPRNHGYRKFSDLVDAIGLFETERRGQNLYVRDKRQAPSGRRPAGER
ncbi:OST-HTH/LOTUS domain-containing protein, partial [Ideonella sp.]|uniref:OST-HTH/LOTUS domain-containing protein n=1 Tax=Ideonella sp. TaxID=1929293 RepID=UPI003BB61F6B